MCHLLRSLCCGPSRQTTQTFGRPSQACGKSPDLPTGQDSGSRRTSSLLDGKKKGKNKIYDTKDQSVA